MKNEGYTIIEAVIAMFLVVVMVGAVFSSLMAGRRAIVTAADKEEVLYTMQSAYSMIKDCKGNDHCLLKDLDCSGANLKECDGLYTFNFENICKNGNGTFNYSLTDASGAYNVKFYQPTTSQVDFINMFEVLNIQSNCNE